MHHLSIRLFLSAFVVFAVSCKKEKPREAVGALEQKESSAAAPDTHLGVIVAISSVGKTDKPLSILNKKKQGWGSAQNNDSLFADDKLKTDISASAIVKLSNENEITLNGDTLVQYISEQNLKLESGELWVNLKNQLNIDTPFGKTTAGPGTGSIKLYNEKLIVSWVSGNATLTGKTGSISLNGGDEVTATASELSRTIIRDTSALTSWTSKVRQAVTDAASADQSNASLPSISGLGTLIAKLPGGSKPLPFNILAEDIVIKIQDNMAITRIEQVFKNPTNQTVEAEYKFPIPENAYLTGYDMEVNGRMMRGEIVERDKGRKILKKVIDDFVYQMRDPALTEWESGTTFKTRIFPIKPKEEKRVVLTHLMPLSGAKGEYRYTLPVTMGIDTPTIPKFRITASVSSSHGSAEIFTPLYQTQIQPTENSVKIKFEASEFIPRADFVIEIRSPSEQEAALALFNKEYSHDSIIQEVESLKIATQESATPANPYMQNDEGFFLLKLSPKDETSSLNKGQNSSSGFDWMFLIDTSESRFGPDMEIQKRLLDTLIDILGPNDRVKIMAYDTFPVLMSQEWHTPSYELRKQVQEFLAQTEPGGATNLSDALFAARTEADSSRAMKVVVMGDGAATIGELSPGVLAETASKLFDYPHSVSTIGVGSSVDRLLLQTIADKSRGCYFSISGGEDLLTAAVRTVTGLRSSVLEDAKLSLNGIQVRDVLPSSLSNISLGSEAIVVGRYSGQGKLVVGLSGRIENKPWSKQWEFDIKPTDSRNSFIPIIWGAKKIDELTLQDSETSKQELVSVSKKYSIASRITSFIVLENEAMYREFKVDRSQERIAWSGEEEIDFEKRGEVLVDSIAGGSADDSFAPSEDRAAKRSSAGASASKSSAPIARSVPSSSLGEARGAFDMKDEVPRSRSSAYDWNRYRRPITHYNVKIRSVSSEVTTEILQKARELESAVLSSPRDRRARKNFVAYLVSNSMTDEAFKALNDWSRLDRSNPEFHMLKGDALKLQGNLPGALRAYSSVIDLQPENTKVLNMLASYFESHNRWKESYPFLAADSAKKPTDGLKMAKRAITAFKAGQEQEALKIASDMAQKDFTGIYSTIQKRFNLPKSEKDAILSLANNRILPLMYDTPIAASIKSAGLKIVLSWEGNSKLDIWPSGVKEKYLGANKNAQIVSPLSGQERTLIVSGGAEGRYRIQIICADSNGCHNVAGNLQIEAHGVKRKIPFVLNAPAKDVAIVSIEKEHYWKHYR